MNVFGALATKRVQSVGIVVFRTKLNCPKETAVAWRDTLADKLSMTFCNDIQIEFTADGFVQLVTQDGDQDDVLDEIRVGDLGLTAFSRRYQKIEKSR